MTFSSITFILFFLPALLLIYYIVPKQAKNYVLFIASLIFCITISPVYTLILIGSALFNFLSGIAIDKTRHKKTAITFNVLINLAMLVFLRTDNPISTLCVAIYTLRALSYTIDVYRRTTATQYSFISFILYMMFFPLIIEGPVVRYNDISRQIARRRSTGTRFLDGFSKFSAGLCKKAVIADSLYPLHSTIMAYDLTGISAAHAWLGIICYGLWLYFVLGGLCDIASGLGMMLGFEFESGFKYPLTARSITSFYSRFNTSLIRWFMTYVHTKGGLSLILTWVLIGLWHGFNGGFAVWGLATGIFIILERYLLKKPLRRIGIFANIYTLFVVTVTLVPFATGNLYDALTFIRAMFSSYGGFGETDFIYNLSSYAVLIIIALLIAMGIPKSVYNRFINNDAVKYIFAISGFILAISYI